MKLYVLLGYLILATTMNVSSAQASFDYGSALDAAMQFYDANRCGPDAGKDNLFSWRGACHTTDEIPGGYHDAGDHVKFGLPQCWSAALLGWAMYEYPSVFESHKEKYFHMMKWFTDYFLACHTSNGSFVYQIGEGNADHGYWGAPEQQPSSDRLVIKAPPGSDVCGEAAAALALMYLNYKSTDESYANKCLDAAKDLYSMAVASAGSKETGRCSDGAGGSFYKSSSHYDDVVWGAIWLYTATGDDKYLDNVDEWILIKNDYGDDPFNKKWAPAWDDVTMFNLVKLAEITGNETYYKGVVSNLDWFKNTCRKSPAGLPIVDTWAPLRYASCEAGLGYTAYRLLGYSENNGLGSTIIDYCLGSNPRNSSYLTGWGTNPPVHPHHRANQPDKSSASTKGIIGALVGGGTDDTYTDDVNQYTVTEVALDYNASFIFGLAAHMYFANGGKPKNMGPSVTITSPRDNIYLPKDAEITVNVTAKDSDGKLTKVELYKGDQLVTSSATSPLTYTFSNATSEDITLYAKATDDSGHTTKSQSVTVHISAPDTPGQMINRSGWVATSSTSSPNAPEVCASALDGDASTRWASGAAMASGMWFLLDMGYPRSFDQITVDATGSSSDFPLRLKVYAGNDTGSMTTPLVTDSGAILNIIELPQAVTAQYIRLVVDEGQGGSWWSIHELNVRSASSTSRAQPTVKTNSLGFGFNAVIQDRSVRIGYHIPKSGRVTIEEYTLDGVRTNVIFDGICNTGVYSFTRNAASSGSKMIFYKMNYGGSSLLTKAVLMH
jgi:endoglucanase